MKSFIKFTVLAMLAEEAAAATTTIWGAATQTNLSSGIMNYVLPIVCGIFNGIFWIGGALAAVVVVYSGIRYITSMEDPGVRKQAKDTIQHAIVGLILLLIATALVGLATNFEMDSCMVMQKPSGHATGGCTATYYPDGCMESCLPIPGSGATCTMTASPGAGCFDTCTQS